MILTEEIVIEENRKAAITMPMCDCDLCGDSVFSDEKGKPILIIVAKERKIIVPDDVNIDEAARVVLDIVNELLKGHNGEAEAEHTEPSMET